MWFGVVRQRLGWRRWRPSSFLVEHHFSGWSQVSARLQLLNWVAALTKTLRVGYAVMVLPWHNPVSLAEQVASLDVLSGGRLDLGIGRGTATRNSKDSAFRLRKPMRGSRRR